jgi:hypothetical protein
MAKRRRKAKNRKQKEESEVSKRFIYTLVGIFVLFVIAFAILRWGM